MKQLKWDLSRIQSFKNPNIKYEQYVTPHDIAADILNLIHTEYDDIENKTILDLGVGTGMLTAAASYFNPAYQLALDICPNALEICKENLTNLELDVDLVRCNFENFFTKKKFDTTIMNPPFGVHNEKADSIAIECALKNSSIVYFLHTKSTRNFILKKYKENIKVIAELKYELPMTYKFHKKKKKIIDMDLYRLKSTK
ncbi:Methyltransferase [Spraguea lophii 42_110]|uniref:Methyltransferase n=1 Tax=Spraguea lophii (strain 42_110) TaxID=1358809 RepID=S7XTY0_SPRLO|nr:Methyltransferase [Spraguea lophii 42_110]